jgi:hypothetical protein
LDRLSALALDGLGGLYLAGETAGALDDQTSAGNSDMVLMRYVDLAQQEQTLTSSTTNTSTTTNQTTFYTTTRTTHNTTTTTNSTTVITTLAPPGSTRILVGVLVFSGDNLEAVNFSNPNHTAAMDLAMAWAIPGLNPGATRITEIYLVASPDTTTTTLTSTTTATTITITTTAPPEIHNNSNTTTTEMPEIHNNSNTTTTEMHNNAARRLLSSLPGLHVHYIIRTETYQPVTELALRRYQSRIPTQMQDKLQAVGVNVVIDDVFVGPIHTAIELSTTTTTSTTTTVKRVVSDCLGMRLNYLLVHAIILAISSVELS